MVRRPVAHLRGSRVVALLAVLAAGVLGGCTSSARSDGRVLAVGAENVYANVIAQIGGRYVHVSSVVNNPLADPHTYEVTARVAQRIDSAQLIVQNGMGYDSYMNNVESATTTPGRHVLVVRQVAGVPLSTWNPHLWYSLPVMATLGRAVEHVLVQVRPQHAAYFAARLRTFELSLHTLAATFVNFRARHRHLAAATSEPVANYLLRELGIAVRTPRQLQAAVMNGVDPSPQDIARQQTLLRGHGVAMLCYNQQVVDAFTSSLVTVASTSRPPVPVVAVYETMPASFTYQSWMFAEYAAIVRAVTRHESTLRL